MAHKGTHARGLWLTMPERTTHVADRPRRCEHCDAPVLITTDGHVTDDHDRPHRCRTSLDSLGNPRKPGDTTVTCSLGRHYR